MIGALDKFYLDLIISLIDTKIFEEILKILQAIQLQGKKFLFTTSNRICHEIL